MVADSVPADSGKTQIFRVARNSENPFANIPRAMINDAQLSWAARGLLAYIFSKPDDWEVRSYDLMRQGGIGRDALRSILQELVLYGYLHREKRRQSDGHFIWESIVYEIPFVGEQEPTDQDITSDHVVYLFQCGHFYKIGVTGDIDRRISQIQVGNPFEVKCLYFVDCDDKRMAYALEAELGLRFKKKLKRGEWFSLNSDDIDSFKRMENCKVYEAPRAPGAGFPPPAEPPTAEPPTVNPPIYIERDLHTSESHKSELVTSDKLAGLRRRKPPQRTLRRPANAKELGETGRGILYEAICRLIELDPAMRNLELIEKDICDSITMMHRLHRGMSDTKLTELVNGFAAFASDYIYEIKLGAKIRVKHLFEYWNRYYKWLEAGKPEPKPAKAGAPAASKVGAARNGWHDRWEASLRQEIEDPSNNSVKGNLESLLLQLDSMQDEAEAIAVYGKVIGR
jgi:predicted GIY-YIG superfamily endonuclease